MTPFETWWKERVQQPITRPVTFQDVWDAATAAEREACAQVAASFMDGEFIATAIRARAEGRQP